MQAYVVHAWYERGRSKIHPFLSLRCCYQKWHLWETTTISLMAIKVCSFSLPVVWFLGSPIPPGSLGPWETASPVREGRNTSGNEWLEEWCVLCYFWGHSCHSSATIVEMQLFKHDLCVNCCIGGQKNIGALTDPQWLYIKDLSPVSPHVIAIK